MPNDASTRNGSDGRSYIRAVAESCRDLRVDVPEYDGLENSNWGNDVFKDNSPHLRLSPPPSFVTGPYAGILDSVLDAIGSTPMIRLSRFSDSSGIPCELLAKCEFLSAGGSVKDRIAKAMVLAAEDDGVLKRGDILVEPTSGNTGIGLCMIGAVKGYNVVITLPEKMSQEKLNVMQVLGATILRTPTEAAWNAPDSHISLALKLEKALPNAHVLDQYQNPLNPLVHYDVTAEEILRQCSGRLDVLVISAGTGGTITGVAKKIKERIPSCKVVGVDPKGSILALPDTLNDDRRLKSYLVEGIGYDFIPTVLDRSVVDLWVKTDDAEAFEMARKLIATEGLLVGGSSGSAVAGALKAIQMLGLKNTHRVVVLLPDSSRNYLNKFISDEWMVDNGFSDSSILPRQYPVLGEKTVGDLLPQQFESLDVGSTIATALTVFRVSKAKFLFVVDETRKPVGVLDVQTVLSNVANEKVVPDDLIEAVTVKKFVRVGKSCLLRRVAQMLELHPYVCVIDELTEFAVRFITSSDLLEII